MASTDPALDFITPISLHLLRRITPVSLAWVNEQETRGLRVGKYRKQYDGDHDIKLTANMRRTLRLSDPDDNLTINVMSQVVDMKADRCVVQGIEATTDSPKPDDSGKRSDDPRIDPTAWAQEVAEMNHFDILQGDVHSNTFRDGDAYVLIEYDSDEQRTIFNFEEAWDGVSGMLMYYPSRNLDKPLCAIKIWQEEATDTDGSQRDTINTRITVYYADRIKRYVCINGAAPTAYIEPGETDNEYDWVSKNNRPLGVPVIPFRNGRRGNYGVSELKNAIGPQAGLNRFYASAVATAEVTAFRILWTRGFPAPAEITPGMIIEINGGAPLDSTQIADMGAIEAGDLTAIIGMVDKTRGLIADITTTPSPDLTGGSQHSGEYLKQLEVGLLGKVNRFMTRNGASWESAFDMAHKVQSAFSAVTPPPYKRFVCKWKSPEMRNDSEVVDNATKMQPFWGTKQTIRAAAEVWNLDEKKIAEIVKEKMDEDIALARAMQAQQPTTPGSTNGQTGATKPAGNAPAIRGNKLPTNEALTVNPITPDELAAVGAMHRSMVKA